MLTRVLYVCLCSPPFPGPPTPPKLVPRQIIPLPEGWETLMLTMGQGLTTAQLNLTALHEKADALDKQMQKNRRLMTEALPR